MNLSYLVFIILGKGKEEEEKLLKIKEERKSIFSSFLDFVPYSHIYRYQIFYTYYTTSIDLYSKV